MPALTFSERILLRRRTWWKRPGLDAPHRLRERLAAHTRDDPDEAWRCCAAWPRTLMDKRNAREFAARHGCPLPELYWSGRPSAAPVEAFPARYAVRPVRGARRTGVLLVDGATELLRGVRASPDEVRRLLPRRTPVLVEELIRREDDGGLPLEYKFHTFGDTVAAVMRLDRRDIRTAAYRYYTLAWEPYEDRFDTSGPQDVVVPGPPPGLDEMVELARRIGAAVGTYLRVDFFGTADGGFVFNEFSATPVGGAKWTPFADATFGALWVERLGDAL